MNVLKKKTLFIIIILNIRTVMTIKDVVRTLAAFLPCMVIIFRCEVSIRLILSHDNKFGTSITNKYRDAATTPFIYLHFITI